MKSDGFPNHYCPVQVCRQDVKSLLSYPRIEWIIFFLLLFNLLFKQSFSQQIPFDSGLWQLTNGTVAEFQGRLSLAGSAYIKDLVFQDGTIDVDVWFSRERGYPGINFRIQSPQDFENFYIRPHRGQFYPDALQYVPSFNGIRGWQLHNGEGYTAGFDFPYDQWVHFRMEVKGRQARVFIQDMESPALLIHDLKHGISSGTVGLESTGTSPVYFSNFVVDPDAAPDFDEPPLIHFPTGIIPEWEISQSIPMTKVDPEKTPGQQGLEDLEWEKVTADPSGLIDIARYRPRSGREPDCIFARTHIYCDEAKTKEFRFGYSDAISLFFNGNLIFFGNSVYQQRDPSFLGIVGLNDAVFLPLQTGKNELVLLITESSGGWGFMFQDAKAIEKEDQITEVWKTANQFSISESVLYDPRREVLYVTNFDQFNLGNPQHSQFISRVSLKGEILELKWVDGLSNPLGMTFFNDILYVVERKEIARINPDQGEVINRIEIPGALFLNDVAVDNRGIIYVSDSRKNVVWRCQGTSCEVWLQSPAVVDPNVLFIDGDRLLVGSSGDQCLKAFDLETAEMSVVARLGKGFIDGIRPDPVGNLLVSHWEGRLFQVTPEGKVKKILDITGPEYNLADFEYLADRDIIYIPTFYDNRVQAFKLGLK